MKQKKWGALLLALCMIVMMFPTTVMANGDSLAGPDAETKVIKNDLIVQLPPSLDVMIGTSAGNGNWLAVTSEPKWENDTILSYVRATQEFYDSTGKKLADADTFQNNSRYTMKMTFQSFGSYHGDYYYVLSGKNNVYVQYMNGTGEREPMKVTVNKDENGNPVITATYSFSIGTPPEEPVNAYECSIYNMNTNENQTGETAKMDVVIGGTTQYRVQLFTTDPNGLKEYVTTDSMRFDYTTVKDISKYVDINVETEYNSYVVSLTGKQMLNDYSGCDFFFNPTEGNTLLGDASVTFNFIEPTDITLNKTYKLSDQTWQTLYYRYQPDENGSQYYTLRADNVRDCTPNDGHGKYSIYKSTDKNPIIFMLSRLTMEEECEFELVEYKLPTEIEILPIPDSIIEDIEKNGKEADLNGIKFTVTYDDGSTYTHTFNGKRQIVQDGGDPFVLYEMDCWDIDKNVYQCIPDFDKNSICVYSFAYPRSSDGSGYGECASDEITFSVRQKVNIAEGLDKVTGDLENTEYNTVEKIKNKLTETIVSNEGYIADNTALYDIELVTSEDGGQTWVPVTAENFPAEGIVVTLPYPEGTNAADYDFTVVHMFDEDVNGHKAGEVETPEVTEGENGISFRLMGTSPVMIGYKKVAATHTHSYGEWTDCKDGSNHQRSCSCGDVQKEAHVLDDGKVTKEATKDAEGIKTYTCKTCGATKTKSIPKLTSDTTPSKPGDSTNPNTDTTSPKTGDSANIALWIVVMLASAAGLSCTYFVKRKKVNN